MDLDDDEDVGIPEWVVTFGDMMSLLLTFFIMLLSMSEMKQEDRFQAMVESMRKRFGHETSIDNVMPGSVKARNSRLAKLATMGRAQRFNIMRGGAMHQAPKGDYPKPPDGVPRPIPATNLVILFFDDQGDELTPEHQRILAVAKEMFAGKPQKIEIRAHTSRRPVAQGTHWDLAYRRGTVVMNYLVDNLEMDRRRMVVALAGPNELVDPDTDTAGAQRNSRVEVYMLDAVINRNGSTGGENSRGTDAPFELPE
jgi:chemotaxis protein MotB